VISSDNVTFDCRGHTVFGNGFSGSSGFFVNASNVTIKNCNIVGFFYSVYSNFASNLTIENVSSSDAFRDFSFSGDCSFNFVDFYGSSGYPISVVHHSLDSGTFSGIVACGDNVSVSNVRILGDTGVFLKGHGVSLVNANISGNTGVTVVDCTNCRVQNTVVTLNSNGDGVYVYSSKYVVLENVTVKHSNMCIRFDFVDNAILKDSRLYCDYDLGIFNTSGFLAYNNNLYGNVLCHNADNIFFNYTLVPRTNIAGKPFVSGNFWRTFSKSCEDSNMDGFCDSGYVLSCGIDYRPLSTTFVLPDAYVKNAFLLPYTLRVVVCSKNSPSFFRIVAEDQDGHVFDTPVLVEGDR